ncbi:MAG: RimK/LysX family protein [Desulfobacterales bacterium]|nr:RimK/LysX family protein [Desulfobacterales bacterium]
MSLSKKTDRGLFVFIVVVLLSLVLSCASQKSSRPDAVETAAKEPPAPVESPPAKTPEAPPQAAVEPAAVKVPPPAKQLQGMRIIGEVEPVTIVKAGLTLPARIDTGATTSSLDARDIERFERDGKKWVRFILLDRRSGKKVKVEGRLTRTVEITRHGTDPQYRPVVKLKAILGQAELYREFSLTDRSAFTYPVLIGRNFLQGEFIVDVTRKNTTTPMSEGN